MHVMQALLYLAAVLLLALAAVGLVARVPGALLGAACAVLAFSLPVVTTLCSICRSGRIKVITSGSDWIFRMCVQCDGTPIDARNRK